MKDRTYNICGGIPNIFSNFTKITPNIKADSNAPKLSIKNSFLGVILFSICGSDNVNILIINVLVFLLVTKCLSRWCNFEKIVQTNSGLKHGENIVIFWKYNPKE